MAKLKCTTAGMAGTKHQFPLIGHIHFDKDSVIEVDDKIVAKFLEIKCGYDFCEVGESNAQGAVTEQEMYRSGLEELLAEEVNALLSVHPDSETKKLKSSKAKIDYLVGKQFVV